MNIILFGPPGAGKGTQAKYLVEKFKLFHVSTGDLLRNEIKKKSDIGKKIVNEMNDGKFVSDDIVNELIKDIVLDPQKKENFIFDGYPRSISQAKNLDLLLSSSEQKINLVIFLNVNKDTLIKRIEKRKIIEKRSDDNLETLAKRYDTYMDTTRPVLDYYSKKPNFHEVDGTLKIDQISAKIDAFLNF